MFFGRFLTVQIGYTSILTKKAPNETSFGAFSQWDPHLTGNGLLFFLRSKLFTSDRKHEFNAVLLVYARSAGIVIDRHNIGVRGHFPETMNHSLSADVVW